MIPRFFAADEFISRIVEGGILLALSIIQGFHFAASTITDSDWSRITGPNGVAFVCSISTLVLWATGVALFRQNRKDSLDREARYRQAEEERSKRDREDRGRHFDDLKSSNKEVVERLMAITTANHEVMMASSRTDMKVADAIHSLETQIHYLTDQIPKKQHYANQD